MHWLWFQDFERNRAQLEGDRRTFNVRPRLNRSHAESSTARIDCSAHCPRRLDFPRLYFTGSSSGSRTADPGVRYLARLRTAPASSPTIVRPPANVSSNSPFFFFSSSAQERGHAVRRCCSPFRMQPKSLRQRHRLANLSPACLQSEELRSEILPAGAVNLTILPSQKEGDSYRT
jgi:hypothetical protein